jgi:hypothetical protein
MAQCRDTPKSGRGRPHSKTLCVFRLVGGRASVLKCGSPLPLSSSPATKSEAQYPKPEANPNHATPQTQPCRLPHGQLLQNCHLATIMQLSCIYHASIMQPSCSDHAVIMQRSCNYLASWDPVAIQWGPVGTGIAWDYSKGHSAGRPFTQVTTNKKFTPARARAWRLPESAVVRFVLFVL